MPCALPKKTGPVPRCRVLLVDDHPIVLDAVECFLAHCPEIEVVGRTSSGPQALELATLHRPDLVIMELAMPELSGMEATRRLAADPNAPRIILTAFHDDPEYHSAAEAAGADGFLPKTELAARLLPLIRSLIQSDDRHSTRKPRHEA